MSILVKVLVRALAAALTLAPPAAAQAQGPTSSLRPSDPAAIVAAAQSCRAAVTAERLDEARLTADGWGRGSVSGDSGLIIFGRGDVLLLSMPGSTMCAVTARLRNMRTFPQLSEALVAAFGRPSQSEANGTQTWLWEDGKVMRVEATGSRQSPAVRIAIMHAGGPSGSESK